MKILLVDDSKSARYALRLQLQRHGVEVDTADSAEAAFEVLEGDLPDAILMDHTMPGMNGFEALEVIRDDPRTSHIPVVMCTSHEDAEFAAAAERKGVVGILPKSVAPEKLPDILGKLRAASAVQPPPEAATPAAAPVPRPAASAPTVPNESDLQQIIDQRIAAQVDDRLDQRIETGVTALLADLRRDIGERIMADVRQLVDERIRQLRDDIEGRLQAARQAQEAQRPAVDDASLHAAIDRLSHETLPDLVKIEIEAERGQIMDLVEQYLHEFAPRAAEDAEGIAQRIEASERAIVEKAQDTARREAESAVATAMSRSRQALEETVQQARTGNRGAYIASVVAAIVGVTAAALVYLLGA